MFVMLAGVPYLAERELTTRERRAVQHGVNRSAAAFLIVLAVAFAAFIVAGLVTDEASIMFVTLIGVWLIGSGIYFWVSGRHQRIVKTLRDTGVLFLNEHAERHQIFVRAIRAEVISRDLHPTDEDIAAMMTRHLIHVDTIERLDETASDFERQVMTSAKEIVDAEKDHREARH